MPRSSFAENPLLRVSRPVSACSRCRSAKVKCDGKLPACTACEKAGRENECSAANDQFARGKERSYVAALELRVEKLERRLKFAKSRKASMALHDMDLPPSAADRKDSLANIQAAMYRKAARHRENSDVNALVSDFGFLSVNATTQDFEPSVSNMTFARLLLAAAIMDPLPEPMSEGPPPRQVAEMLVKYYLTHIYSLYPFFADFSVHSSLDNLYQDGRRLAKHPDCWLLYMIFAIASAAQSRTLHDDFYRNGVEFVGQAMRFADRALMPGKETQIRSLILLTQYSMFDPAHFDSWHLIGFTARAIVDLGFHQDPPATEPMDKDKLNLRRKIFYSVYALDRSIGMVNARAFSFTDDAINVALPRMTGLGRIPSISGPITGPQSADPAILLFQLRQTQSHWYQTLVQSDPSEPLQDAQSYIWQMCHEMREWFESLPDMLPTDIRCIFDLELKYSYVYCIAPSSRAPILTAHGTVLIFEYAIAYMEALHALVVQAPSGGAIQQQQQQQQKSQRRVPCPLLTYDQALRAYFMASQFLAVMHDTKDTLLAGSSVPVPILTPGTAPPPPMPERRGGDNTERSLACLDSGVAILKTLGERWAIAAVLGADFEARSSELREELKERKAAKDAARLEQQQQQQSPPPHQQLQQHQQSPHQQLQQRQQSPHQQSPHQQLQQRQQSPHQQLQQHQRSPRPQQHLQQQHQQSPPPQMRVNMASHATPQPHLEQQYQSLHQSMVSGPPPGHYQPQTSMPPSDSMSQPPPQNGAQPFSSPVPGVQPLLRSPAFAVQVPQAPLQQQPLPPLPPTRGQPQQHLPVTIVPSYSSADIQWANVDINEMMRQGGI
ncbi:fungal specific transcription factor domain-containing protein [Gaeumannomyces tritici R3-111a-1]|uniref:Fungal specific transcription factor domain-containing protein n=1 Tax=Gaeumannomyces tritici (strain R3-111a-1) TaxID=644352 RepID=J3NWQ0_GAET3|nr:fungal specific transcription factor domain-containing protein [Gaeumannomyces tritici R3-111a-1]EJT75782.1 fungal specific transcription factor domain-containing protein [Gaeumannomyces tritici R3-111a-1]